MLQPATPPPNGKDKDVSSSALSAVGNYPYSINPAYATVSPLLSSFSAYRVDTTTTLLQGQLAGQFIAPSELFCNQSSRPYAVSAAARTADTARTAAVQRLTRVLDSDRELVRNIGRSRLTAQEA